jgi:uncharacterized protein YjbI with pentapeptide repeats
VEWLLATHEDGRGPIDWSDESQRTRQGIDLRAADLRQQNLRGLPLTQIRGGLTFDESFRSTPEQRDMASIHLENANLREAQLQNANLREANLQDAAFKGAQMQGANLQWADWQGAYLAEVQLQKAYLYGTKLRSTFLVRAQLQGADLQTAVLENATLNEITLSDETYGAALLADINWGNINLAVVDWEHVTRLGDEQVAHLKKDSDGKIKDKQTRVREHKEAVRANRQLAVVLRDQGLNEDAARFAFRAQLMQRKVYWYQRKIWKYLGSLFLGLLSGYGYRVGRCFIAYALVIGIFASIYYYLGAHLAPNEAIVISMTAFHGRGFFPEQFQPGDPQAMIAAIEAFVGLLIEVTFIAALTQRLFGK